jgi:hypothetical protein
LNKLPYLDCPFVHQKDVKINFHNNETSLDAGNSIYQTNISKDDPLFKDSFIIVFFYFPFELLFRRKGQSI